MFLTRFPLNGTRRETRAMLASPYRMHAAVAGSIPPSAREADAAGRTLWRVDRRADGGADLLIVSTVEPSLVGLDEQAGWPDCDAQWDMRSYDAFLESIAAGQEYRFRLTANPVVSRKSVTDAAGRAKRLPHLTVLQQAAWLIGEDAYAGTDAEIPDFFAGRGQARALRNGFQVPIGSDGFAQMVVSNSRSLSFKKGHEGPRITLATAQYDGLLEVVDADKLRHALVSGIGHAKGFGCGLMTLARKE